MNLFAVGCFRGCNGSTSEKLQRCYQTRELQGSSLIGQSDWVDSLSPTRVKSCCGLEDGRGAERPVAGKRRRGRVCRQESARPRDVALSGRQTGQGAGEGLILRSSAVLQRNWNLDATIGFNACPSEPESELRGKKTFALLNIVMVMSETALQF